MRKKRRKLQSDINVVPYIDVMLVLLIIFMVTAPLMHLGVDIQLPKVAAQSLKNDKPPILVSLNKDGTLFLTLGAAERESIEPDVLVTKISAFVRQNPGVPVLFGGDAEVDYGRVMQAMVLLQQAGVPNVGLMTAPPATSRDP